MPPKDKPAGQGQGKNKKKADADGEDKEQKIPAPDKAAFTAANDKIQQRIDVIIEEQKKLSAKITEHNAGQADYRARRNDLFSQMKAFKEKIDEIMERKNGISSQMGAKRAEDQKERADLNKLWRSLPCTDEDAIEKRLETIEITLRTDTLTLKAEKDLMKEITDLKRCRPQLQKLRDKQKSVGGSSSLAPLKEEIGDINAELDAYRKGKAKVSEELSKMDESGDNKNLKPLYEERDALRTKLEELKGERDTLRNAFREEEREFQARLRVQREDRYKKAMEQRAKWKEDQDQKWREKRVQDMDSNPHTDQITLVEQTIAFCKSLTAVKEDATKEEKKEIQHDLPEGAQILTKKEDREEFYFVPTAKKKNKSKSKGGNKAEGVKPIRHNAATFGLFKCLGLAAPITVQDVPELLEQLEGKLEDLNQKTKEWEGTLEDRKAQIMAGKDYPVSGQVEGEAGQEDATEN